LHDDGIQNEAWFPQIQAEAGPELLGCHVLILADENYPAMLREIYDPTVVNGVPIRKKGPIIGL
jgi:hypothetical protein